MRNFLDYLHVKLRAWTPTGCLQTPRSDVLVGTARWRWLYSCRKEGHSIDPTVEVRCSGDVKDQLQFGKKIAIDRASILWAGRETGDGGRIHIGDGTRVGPYSYLGSLHELRIGRGCLIGAYCYIITANHRFEDGSRLLAEQGFSGGDIHLGDHSWLGSQVVILPGVAIGERSVVAAGAVVTKNVPAGELWGGVPARKIRDLTTGKAALGAKGDDHGTD